SAARSAPTAGVPGSVSAAGPVRASARPVPGRAIEPSSSSTAPPARLLFRSSPSSPALELAELVDDGHADGELAPHGAGAIAATELARRVHRWAGPLSATKLAAWLVDGGLAVERDGLLEPTALAVELGGGLEH